MKWLGRVVLALLASSCAAITIVPSSVPTATWMASINASTPLHKLVLPGAHDACAYKLSEPIGASLVLTQSSSLTEQLERGIRYFDFRVGKCAATTDKLCMFHGNFYLELDFGGAVAMVKQYVATHATECVVVRLQREVDQGLKDFQSFVETNYLNQDLSFWFQPNGTPVTQVSLADVRGKALLFWSSGDRTSRFGYDYDLVDSSESFRFSSIGDMVIVFKERAMASGGGDHIGWFENPTSGLVYPSLLGHRLPVPKELGDTAKKMQSLVNSVLDTQPMHKGIVSMDFPTDEVIGKLIMMSVRQYFV